MIERHPDRYQPLRDALAAGPTPGPWRHDSDPIKGDPLNRVRFRVVALGRTIVQTYYGSTYPGATFTGGETDNRYIAACDPDTIAALLKEREALRDALQEIIDPISYMKRRLQDGERLNGGAALQLANDVEHLRGIARTAIARLNGADNAG